MGIHSLAKTLGEHAADSMEDVALKDLTGRVIAVDASNAIYQFLIAIRSSGEGGASAQLMNEAGEVTSHLVGFWGRTIRFIELGIKPVYIFEGKPPDLKRAELRKRREKRKKAEKDLKVAEEEGNTEDMNKFAKRLVTMGDSHINDCKRLLTLMGLPVVDAPAEAEAQAAVMAKEGVVWAAVSEDMDTLCFQATRFIRRLAVPDTRRRQPPQMFTYSKVLEALDMTPEAFVDFCILCGSDYSGTIRGVGPVRALRGIKRWKSMERFLLNLDKGKHKLPEPFPYEEARRLLLEPEVTDPHSLELKWSAPNESGLLAFLCEEKGFDPIKVQRGIDKLKKARRGGQQSRMDSFFRSAAPKPKPAPAASSSSSLGKRKLHSMAAFDWRPSAAVVGRLSLRMLSFVR
eukprot:PLAT12545.3.p1 GENE.PLAT12545.3~~PLAT12545.3.p1  ORF type:complete len:402 (+),score=173.25 PLAT12545.3:63-1268(+)